jgi:hypothetical protein
MAILLHMHVLYLVNYRISTSLHIYIYIYIYTYTTHTHVYTLAHDTYLYTNALCKIKLYVHNVN